MKTFSSKLALNQELLKENHSIESGEIVLIKKYSTACGDREEKILMKKCIDCGELFFQNESCTNNYVRCEKCSKLSPKKVFPHEYK
jgi:hypothetical protein